MYVVVIEAGTLSKIVGPFVSESKAHAWDDANCSGCISGVVPLARRAAVLTYRQLIAKLTELTSEQLDTNVTVESDGEAFSADLCVCDENHDSLDRGHPVLYFQ